MAYFCRFLTLVFLSLPLFSPPELLAAATDSATSHPPGAALSLQGFSGILNTPTAHVQELGTLQALYSNQKDLFGRQTSPRQDNYLISVGFFNFAEIGGRLTEADGIARDLSANVKFSTAPVTAHLPLAPAVALGIQDLGGGSTFFRTTYLAASVDPLPWLRLTAGYGRGSDRMQGGFGGVEVKAHDWIDLVGEYDTKKTNVGIRLITPPLPYVPARLTFLTKISLSDSPDLAMAFGLTLPLDMKRAAASSRMPPPAATDQDLTASAAEIKPATSGTRASRLSSLHTRLSAAGFAHVRVGILNGTVLVVEYENVRYNHNELDAIGVVAGIATFAAIEGVDTLSLVVKRKGLRILLLSFPLREMRIWLADPLRSPAPALIVSPDPSSVAGASFVDADSRPDWLHPSLILSPGLKTFVGTEVGVFDYLLSVKPELQVTTWKGAVLNARWDLPVAWSNNFDTGREFASARNDSTMDRLMLFQGINLAPGLMANLGGGMILPDINGTLNELVWTPQNGIHRFRLGQALARNSASQTDITVLLGSYRLYLPTLDLFVEGTAGRFWGQDSGGVVTLKRFFGDTAIDLYYKNTETLANKRWQAAGMQISFPLTSRRDMKRAPLQVRGNEEWGYGQETVLAVSGQKSNDTISATLGVNPLPSPSIHRSYLNRDRLNDAYIQSHKERIKGAWKTFENNLTDAFPQF